MFLPHAVVSIRRDMPSIADFRRTFRAQPGAGELRVGYTPQGLNNAGAEEAC